MADDPDNELSALGRLVKTLSPAGRRQAAVILRDVAVKLNDLGHVEDGADAEDGCHAVQHPATEEDDSRRMLELEKEKENGEEKPTPFAQAVKAVLDRLQSDTPANPFNFGSGAPNMSGAPAALAAESLAPTAESWFAACSHNALAEVRAVSERQSCSQPKALLKLQPDIETDDDMKPFQAGKLCCHQTIVESAGAQKDKL